MAALVFLFLRVDLARRLVRAQYLSRRASGQRPDLMEKSPLRLPRRLLLVGNAVAIDLPARETI